MKMCTHSRPTRITSILFSFALLAGLSFATTQTAMADVAEHGPTRILLSEAGMRFVPDETAADRVTPYGQATSNCGTSAIYMDVPSRGKAVVTWSLHSTRGPMLYKNLTINHGPAIGGQIVDKGVFARLDYSKTKTWTGLRGYFGASLHGTVTVAGGKCVLFSTYTTQIKMI